MKSHRYAMLFVVPVGKSGTAPKHSPDQLGRGHLFGLLLRTT